MLIWYAIIFIHKIYTYMRCRVCDVCDVCVCGRLVAMFTPQQIPWSQGLLTQCAYLHTVFRPPPPLLNGLLRETRRTICLWFIPQMLSSFHAFGLPLRTRTSRYRSLFHIYIFQLYYYMVCVVHIVCMDMCFYLPNSAHFSNRNIRQRKAIEMLPAKHLWWQKKCVVAVSGRNEQKRIRTCRNDAALETGRKYRG